MSLKTSTHTKYLNICWEILNQWFTIHEVPWLSSLWALCPQHNPSDSEVLGENNLRFSNNMAEIQRTEFCDLSSCCKQFQPDLLDIQSIIFSYTYQCLWQESGTKGRGNAPSGESWREPSYIFYLIPIFNLPFPFPWLLRQWHHHRNKCHFFNHLHFVPVSQLSPRTGALICVYICPLTQALIMHCI